MQCMSQNIDALQGGSFWRNGKGYFSLDTGFQHRHGISRHNRKVPAGIGNSDNEELSRTRKSIIVEPGRMYGYANVG